MKKFLQLSIIMFATVLVAQTPEGTWLLKPVAGAMGVGPSQGDISWWNNTAGDVTARACFFDNKYVFNANGTFQNVMQTESWVETWQDGTGDGCRTPVAPHNGSNAATWSYASGTLTLTGVGAHIGLAKVINGAEITSPSQAPASITYLVTSISTSEMTLDINFGPGFWRFILQKEGIPTCSDGIQNGDETGIDCGGTNCAPCASAPTVAAPTPPERPVPDVISIFSNAYTNIAVNEWGPYWGDYSARINNFPIAGNATKVMEANAGQVFAGIDFAPSKFDATPFSHFHMDYWMSGPLATGQTLSIKLSNHDGAGETSAIQTIPTPVADQWISLDVPLSNFVAASDPANLSRNNIAQIVITAARADNNIPVKIYMDNIYFHKNTLGIEDNIKTLVGIYPNPVENELKVLSEYNIMSLEIFDSNGKKLNIPSIEPNAYDVSGLSNGLYIVKIALNNNSVVFKKFIK